MRRLAWMGLLLAACGAVTPLDVGEEVTRDAGADCSPPEEVGWSIDLIERAGFGGWASDLVVDEDGTAHVAYDAGLLPGTGTWQSRHAAGASGAWTLETTFTGVAFALPSLALDANGNAHVAYQGNGRERLVGYATNASGDWTAETLDPEGGGLGATVALDPGGDVHIAWVHFVLRGAELRHAVRRGEEWEIEALDSWDGTHWGSALAIGPAGVVHIVYVREGALVHGTLEGDAWSTEILDEIDWVFGRGYQCPSMVVTADGAHVAVQRLGPDVDLVYATNAGGAWRMEVADAGEGDTSKGWGPSLAIDASGAAHASHIATERSDTLLYTTNVGGTWRTEAVDRVDGFPYGCEITSIDVDGVGAIHLSFSDNETHDVLHATRPAPPPNDCPDGG